MGLISCIPSDSGGGGNDDDDDDRGGAMANGGMSGTGGVMIPGAGGGMEPGAGGMSMSVGGNMAPMGGMGPGPGPGLCDRICDSLADCVDGITVEDCMAQCEVVVDEDPEGGRLAESCAETYLAGGRCAIDDYSACASPGGGSEECESGCDIITSCDPDEDFAECIVQCGELEARDPAYMNHVLNCIYTHLDNNECDFEAFEECENRGTLSCDTP